MTMSVEEENKMEVDGETRNTGEDAREPSPESYKDKYRELKAKLKYLVYEHECFEVEVQRAQAKLLELSHDKSYLLDQLMRYEPVLISDDEDRDELTDLSASEDEQMYTDLSFMTQPSPSVPPPAVKSSGTPTPSSTPLFVNPTPQVTPKPTELGRQTITKASVITNSATKTQGTKRQSKANKMNSGAAVKIAKTVSRTRLAAVNKQPPRSQVIVSHVKPPPSLVVSLPRSAASLRVTSLGVVTNQKPHPPQDGSHDPQSKPPVLIQVKNSVHTVTASLHTPPPNPPSQQLTPPPLTSSPHPPPPLTTSKVTLPSSTLGALPSSSSSSSSTSSSDSDSEETSSTSTSGTRNGHSVERDPASPVQLIAEAKTSSALLRPKAITSPVKVAPPQSNEIGMSTPPPLLSPLLSPTGSQVGWTRRSTSDLSSPSHTGFIPLAPSLSSPPSTLPFSSLSKQHKSAFQIVSPRIHQQDASDATDTSYTDGRNSNEGTV